MILTVLTSCNLRVPDVLLAPSTWHQVHWSGDRATLTLTHLNKEDEGLYTLRISTKSGCESYSAYIFVRGEPSRRKHPTPAGEKHSVSNHAKVMTSPKEVEM